MLVRRKNNHQFANNCWDNGESMNTKNNSRRRESREKICKVFVQLLQSEELGRITVSDICKKADVNRSTFYANYLDVYDLADRVREELESQFTELFSGYDTGAERTGALRMFTHIKENQLFYKTYFKLCYDEKHLINVYDVQQAEAAFDGQNLKYHIEFFRNGLNAIIKMWLAGGCQESPEEMADILKQEYRGR